MSFNFSAHIDMKSAFTAKKNPNRNIQKNAHATCANNATKRISQELKRNEAGNTAD